MAAAPNKVRTTMPSGSRLNLRVLLNNITELSTMPGAILVLQGEFIMMPGAILVLQDGREITIREQTILMGTQLNALQEEHPLFTTTTTDIFPEVHDPTLFLEEEVATPSIRADQQQQLQQPQAFPQTNTNQNIPQMMLTWMVEAFRARLMQTNQRRQNNNNNEKPQSKL